MRLDLERNDQGEFYVSVTEETKGWAVLDYGSSEREALDKLAQGLRGMIEEGQLAGQALIEVEAKLRNLDMGG